MAHNKQQLFVDEHHNNHQKMNVLGTGGQGIVYRTSDSDIAIKLATIKDSEDVSGVDTGLGGISWDGTNLFGTQVPSGMYIYKLIGEDQTLTKKMVLMK